MLISYTVFITDSQKKLQELLNKVIEESKRRDWPSTAISVWLSPGAHIEILFGGCKHALDRLQREQYLWTDCPSLRISFRGPTFTLAINFLDRLRNYWGGGVTPPHPPNVRPCLPLRSTCHVIHQMRLYFITRAFVESTAVKLSLDSFI